MAYINAEEVKSIRVALKKEFPAVKFSVTKRHHSVVVVSIMKSDIDFSDIMDGRNHMGLNRFWIDDNYPAHAGMFKRIVEICKAAPFEAGVGDKWFDKSEIETDYHHTAYYIDVNIGKWDKPYEMV